MSKTVKGIKTLFNDKSKTVDIKWKIETFKQEKKHIIDFMIEFKVLAIKAKTNDMYTIFIEKEC